MSYRWNNVAGTGNCITAEEFCRRRCREDVAPDSGRRCTFVYECLLELLEDALEDDNNNNNNHHCCCRR